MGSEPSLDHPGNHLANLAARLVATARPGEEVEIYLGRAQHTEVRVFGGEIESLSSANTAGVGIRVIADHRQGFAYAGSLDDEALAATLAEARDNAGFGTADEYLVLPGPDGVAPANLDLYRHEMATVPTDEKVRLALEVERATLAGDPRIRAVESAGYGDTISESAIASTAGIHTTARRTVCSISANAIAGERADTHTGYGYSVGRHPGELDVATAAADAARRSTRLLGAIKPSSRRVKAVFDPLVTARFLGVLASALSAESVQKGRSLFAGREGEPVAAPCLTLVDDPTDPRAYGASCFDAEGLSSRRNSLIAEGRLNGFLHNAYTARRAGISSNACAVRGGYKSTPGAGSRALALAPGTRSQEELLAGIEEGILVLSVQGLHSGTNSVSGDFSVGVEGLTIRNGAIAEPIREATIASDLRSMLTAVEAVGRDLEWLPGGAAGLTLVVGDIALSGT